VHNNLKLDKTPTVSVSSSLLDNPTSFQVPGRVSNPVFTETEKPGNPGFFSKPKNRFLAAYKPGFSVFNFYLQCLVLTREVMAPGREFVVIPPWLYPMRVWVRQQFVYNVVGGVLNSAECVIRVLHELRYR